MITQCSPELLESALSGDLPPEREECLHRHLDECQACATALHQLAGGDAWRRETAAMLTTDELDSALRVRDEWSSVDFTVEHLEPADEPDLLGRLGGYDVLEIIGHGGMGVVLKAFDRELKRCIAIKVLSPHLAQSSLARKRFTREAQAAAAVVHPNVMAIHNVQPGGPLPFLVMPLVAGESLAQRLAAQGRLDLKETLRVGMQAAAALAAAHEQGLVHRDVKPANILLEKGVERAVLTDFGLARAADDVSMTRWGIISGTPQYMSPEQARGEALDGRSDLFSLGCVLYEMATGVSPFRADSMMATLRRLIDDPPQAMSSLNPELPPWFVAVVERLLEKDAARRFASAKEVNELLEGCLAHLQQPANVPLPNIHISLRRDECITIPARRDDEYDAGKSPGRKVRKPLITGAIAMLTLLGVCLFAVGVVETTPPDIAGRWSGEDWGQVALSPATAGEYSGTFSDTVSKQPGKLSLRWSRIERRFNGTWSEGEERFGELSIRLAGDEIRGALTTDSKSKINPATPRLAPFLWTRAGPLTSDAESKVDPNVATAEHFVDLMSNGEFDEAMGYFDDTMKKMRSPAVLKTLWEELVAHGGKFSGRGQPRTEHNRFHDVVYVPGKWERFQLDFQFTFDKQGRIADLNTVTPGWSVADAGSRPPASGAPLQVVSIKKFTAADAVLSGSVAVHGGAWSAALKSPETLHLFEVADPGAEKCKVFYRAKLRTQDFKGQVYLEMWCRLPGKGEFFSRGLDNTVTGTSGWVSCETPFILEAGQQPDLIRLNVVAKGEGVVMVKDVELWRSEEQAKPRQYDTLLEKSGEALIVDPANPYAVRQSAPTREPYVQGLPPVYFPKAASEAARRIQSQNNMRQIALGVFNYSSANRDSFPRGYIADKKTGKPLLSWRVAILPFIEQDALYRQFHLDEPWDSEHNKKLAERAVAIYRSPASKAKPAMTNYLTVRGKDTAFPGKEGVKIMDITDGTMYTIMIVEADDSKAVPWTKPDDLEYDEKNPSAGLGSLFSGGFNVAMCDGSTRFLPSTTDAETLRRLFNRHDGEPVDWERINGRPRRR